MLADKHYPVATGDSGIKLMSSYHLKETSGAAAAVVNLRDGGATGTVVIPIRLGANEYADMEFSHPLLSTNKWYVEIVSGAAAGAISGSSATQ